MKKSRRTYNGVHLNKKSNTQDVVEQSLTKNTKGTKSVFTFLIKKSLKQLRCLKNNPDTKKKRGNRKGAFIATPVKSK